MDVKEMIVGLCDQYDEMSLTERLVVGELVKELFIGNSVPRKLKMTFGNYKNSRNTVISNMVTSERMSEILGRVGIDYVKVRCVRREEINDYELTLWLSDY